MQALFEIKKCFPNVHKPRPYGEQRQYFIAAEEEVWDYAPTVPADGLVTVQTDRNVEDCWSAEIFLNLNFAFVWAVWQKRL